MHAEEGGLAPWRRGMGEGQLGEGDICVFVGGEGVGGVLCLSPIDARTSARTSSSQAAQLVPVVTLFESASFVPRLQACLHRVITRVRRRCCWWWWWDLESVRGIDLAFLGGGGVVAAQVVFFLLFTLSLLFTLLLLLARSAALVRHLILCC